jgi:hypothetical protein
VARLAPLVPVAPAQRALGLGKDRFVLPQGFDELNADEIREMF